MVRWKVVRCPHCRSYAVTRAEKVFKCPKCGRKFSMKVMPVLWWSFDYHECWNKKVEFEVKSRKERIL